MSERTIASNPPSATEPAVGAESTRRGFLKTSGVAFAGVALAETALFSRSAHAGGDETLKVGLIGCGGRGTGAAAQALAADKNVKLVALGDTFADRLQECRSNLMTQDVASKVAVTDDRCFVGFDAYRQVLDSDIDVVLLCSPPHFRPLHFKAAVAANKHIFAEKPVAVDAPGLRSVMETAEESRRKKLSVVSGLCYRYDLAKRETLKRVHDGAIGEILAIHTSYNTTQLWQRPRKPNWSDMEYQLRNWLYYTWLSGDHNVEQHVHSLDKAAWAMKDETPVSASGIGGRQVRVQPEFGNIFDHHAVVYQYASGVKVFSFCRQQDGCAVDVSDYVIGTKGTADLMHHEIKGQDRWRYREDAPNMYQQEHDELFASIRSGSPLDNTGYMIKSTMLAIMGRMATYTGQTITWEQAMNSQENLTPERYEWGPLAFPAVAMPGITAFA